MRSPGSRKRKNLLLLSLIPLALFVLAVVAKVFLFGRPYQIGPLAHDRMFVPDYPSAQRVNVTLGDSKANPLRGGVYKTVTFDTRDPPNQVVTFYKDELSGRVFEDWNVRLATQTPNSLSASFKERSDYDIYNIYVFEVTTTQVEYLTYVLTHVTIELSLERVF